MQFLLFFFFSFRSYNYGNIGRVVFVVRLNDHPSLLLTTMTSRLPLTIKHLLTLRNPQSLPGPGVNNLLQLFTSTFQDAQTKGVLTGWLVLSVS